jgi:hypothetical protein
LSLPGRLEHGATNVPESARAPSPALHNAEAAVPPLRNAVAEAGEAVASLTSRTADEAVGQTRLLLPFKPGQSLADLDLAPPEAPAKPLREAGENFTAGLGPVASSARRAVDLFLRDIPPVGAQGRRGL